VPGRTGQVIVIFCVKHSEGSGGWVVDERQNILDLFVDIVLAVVVICGCLQTSINA